MMRATFDAAYRPQIASAAAPIARIPQRVAAVNELAARAGVLAQRPVSDLSASTAARASWALALATELYRSPFALLGSPLRSVLRRGAFTVDNLLALAPDDAVDQLRGLHLAAVAELADLLAIPTDHQSLGPSFTASRLCAADADLIVDGQLVELKVRQGRISTATGQWTDALPVADLYQLISYVLFDTADAYRIRSVSLYSARYASLHRWPVQHLLDSLAGEPVNLAAERARVWQLLGGHHRATPIFSSADNR